MTKTVFKLMAAATLIAATAACADTPEKGNPSPDSSGSSTPKSETSAGLPPRPAVLKLDGVNACALLTQAHLAEIKIAKAKPDQIEIGDLGPAPGCYYTNSTQYSYSLVLITSKGAKEWLDATGNVTVKATDVSGYGAVQITFTGVETAGCSIGVDVADGQTLYMNYQPTTKKGESQEQQCDNAKKAVTLALGTLRTLK